MFFCSDVSGDPPEACLIFFSAFSHNLRDDTPTSHLAIIHCISWVLKSTNQSLAQMMTQYPLLPCKAQYQFPPSPQQRPSLRHCSCNVAATAVAASQSLQRRCSNVAFGHFFPGQQRRCHHFFQQRRSRQAATSGVTTTTATSQPLLSNVAVDRRQRRGSLLPQQRRNVAATTSSFSKRLLAPFVWHFVKFGEIPCL